MTCNPQTEARAIAWEVRGAELHRVFLDEAEARELASRFKGAVTPLVHATAAFEDAELADAKAERDRLIRSAAHEFARSCELAERAQNTETLYGPYGWLNGHRALSEDSWELESDPMGNSEEYFAIPLYALTDPFKEIGRKGQARADAAEAEVARLVNDIGAMLDNERALCQAAGPRAGSDDLEAHIKKLRTRAERAEALLAEALRLLGRYRIETPLGNQPHMITHEVDDFARRAREQGGEQ